MATPIVSWYNETNTNEVLNWTIGKVDAGTESAELRVLIWNNREGAAALSDMTNCTVTTKDLSGGNTTEVVTGKWIQAKCNSAGDTAFEAIGGSQGVNMTSGLLGTEKPVKASAAEAGIISGAVNSGALTDTANYTDVSFKASVPLTATAGTTNFNLRLSYQYV
ncbi:MAG: hypothetical protein LBR56_03310 [Sporomusaceae bacterium]|jgi:hypothetical protein|nr:hypothetical protein [Sporomusaceae bacterium]